MEYPLSITEFYRNKNTLLNTLFSIISVKSTIQSNNSKNQVCTLLSGQNTLVEGRSTNKWAHDYERVPDEQERDICMMNMEGKMGREIDMKEEQVRCRVPELLLKYQAVGAAYFNERIAG